MGMSRPTENMDSFPGAQSAGEGAERRCQWDGCMEAGVYRAPTDRTLSEYYVYCLDHVRAYNAQWNYHDGMDDDAMEQEFRSAATWDRPTWKFGQRQAPGRPWHGVYDPFDLFKETPNKNNDSQSPIGTGRNKEAEACSVLGLKRPVRLASLKVQYKKLVKQHHPDANGGAVEAENRMKSINAAYQTLLAALTRN